MFITSTGSADSKIKFLSTGSVKYSEKCFVPGVFFGRSFSAIDEKYALKPSAISVGLFFMLLLINILEG